MKKVKFLIFAGTSEGRKLAETLNTHGVNACVCVATAYGEELMERMEHITVCTGRMDAEEIKTQILSAEPLAVVDATHPYAGLVTENIKQACAWTKTEYIRLLRLPGESGTQKRAVEFPDCLSAARWLDGQEGNILLTTGAKELPVFARHIREKGRIFARVLLQESIFDEIARLGLSKKQMICMQGPFSRELNAAMLKQVQAKFLVTKESGAAGGFPEKVKAAGDAEAVCVIIRRPVQETGYSLEEVTQMLLARCPERAEVSRQVSAGQAQTVTLLGIGMGSLETMTLAAAKACAEADCIIGAQRMLETLKVYKKPMVSMYRSEEIAAYIKAHPEYRKIAVGLSGDVGFYSGAKKLTEQLKDMDVRLLCGISSVVYFAAKLKTSWEDMTLVSGHGRNQNVIGAVRANPRVFTLVSGAESIRGLASDLVTYGLGHVTMHVGADLSYPTETVQSGTAGEFLSYSGPGICVALLENKRAGARVVTHGIPDQAFIRGKAPMTKEEVRSVSVSKLRLTKTAVVYDIGAGTGSVSVECARAAEKGIVYAVEQKADALALLEENKRKFGVTNLVPVQGTAPDALQELPAPSHVFIGGSGGNLNEIVQLLLKKNPDVRIVINCIALETVAQVMTVLRELKPQDMDICCLSAAKAKTLADYHMMMGQNPVYVIAFQMQKAEEYEQEAGGETT